MQHRTPWAFVSILILMVAMTCGGGSEAPTESVAPVTTETIDSATAGNITGMVVLEGQPPAPENIRMNSDPACLQEAGNSTETEYYLVDADGGLNNVFVYVKEGLEGWIVPPTPTDSITLNQDACRYQPHVFGIRVGQTLEILNSDETLHNIHARPTANDEFNTGQPIKDMVYRREFTTPEIMVPFKCDVHGWMNAYVGVLDHPYFAVTESGSFDISTLPPGDYVIEAWHEMLGTQTQNVTITERATAEVSFTFTTG